MHRHRALLGSVLSLAQGAVGAQAAASHLHSTARRSFLAAAAAALGGAPIPTSAPHAVPSDTRGAGVQLLHAARVPGGGLTPWGRSYSQIPQALRDKVGSMKARHDHLCAELSSGAEMPHKQMAALNKELSDLQPVVEGIETLQAVEDEIRGLEDILADLDEDKEMKAMAREDLPELRAKVEDVEKDLLVLLIPKDEVDNRDIILEVRAGAGGDEAAVFALDLFKMYEQYCKTQGWRFEVVDCEVFSMGGGKGTREASATVTGQAVYGYLKFESGVHRVQRVPVTEGAGRVHTSAASVAVLPQAEEVDVEVRDADLRIDTMRSSGAGGQHVNCTDSAVRITHLPSGVVVTCQDQRSQHKNKDKALKVLRARLFDFERQKAAKSRAAARKSQIGSGDRSERIRTYNFPQGRITDHRVNITQHGMEAMMSGVLLNDFIDELAIAERSEYLASLGGE